MLFEQVRQLLIFYAILNLQEMHCILTLSVQVEGSYNNFIITSIIKKLFLYMKKTIVLKSLVAQLDRQILLVALASK